ncbi:MAG: hypothetical protein WAM91_01630 [Candidatus Acidiferrales bacterium]
MSERQFAVWFTSLVMLVGFAVPRLRAQNAPPPEAYSVTLVVSMFGPAQNMQIYRDGMKAVIEQSYPPPQPGAQVGHTRALFDLKEHTSITWDLMQSSEPCSKSNFSGDWGDPFASSTEMNAELGASHATDLGTETVIGIAAKVSQATTNDGVFKIWMDPKSGLMLKLQMTPKDGPMRTMVEVKQVSFGRPPMSVFTLPASCASVANAPREPTEAERIAAETGDDANNFASASIAPASQNSCSVLLRVVQAGTMQPVTGFQVAVDRNYDIDHPPSYTFGVGVDGHMTYAGGSIQELTSQVRNGVLRIDNAPPMFNLELAFGKSGSSSAVVYRKCAGPQTVLLYVIKNPAKTSDGGDWLWVKSGKFATVGPTR